MKRAILAALWAAITAGIVVVPGCYGRNCEGEVQTYGREPGEGRMIDEDTWESSPMDGKWLPYPRQRVYIFDIRDFGERKPQVVLPYISPVEEPNKTASNFTLAGGNLAELSAVDVNRIVIRNGTCSDYYLRLVAMATTRPPTSPGGDEADASADAAIEAGSDAGVDDAGDGGDAEAGP